MADKIQSFCTSETTTSHPKRPRAYSIHRLLDDQK